MSQNTVPHLDQNRTQLGQNPNTSWTNLVVLPGGAPPQPHWSQRLPGESSKAYQAFMDYTESGVSRSLRKLLTAYVQTPANARVLPPARSLATLSGWSARFQWQRRSMEYDDEQHAMRRAQMRKLRAQRQEQIAERDWEMSQQLWRVCNEVLDEALKFFRATVSKIPAARDHHGNITGPERETQTIAIKTRDALAAAKLASELGRLAMGMPTSNLRFETDFANMSDEQLVEFLSRHLGSELEHVALIVPDAF